MQKKKLRYFLLHCSRLALTLHKFLKNDFMYHEEKRVAQGRIEVICGSMFSGKTEELIRRLKRARIARQRVVVFKPVIDVRYSVDDVVSHDAHSQAAIAVEASHGITAQAAEAQVVGIDEAQFFDEGLPEVCNQLARSGKRVIVAGLDMDFKGIPFGPMPQLMASTTTVRMAVARWEFTPSMPILAKIEVSAANTADSNANINHIIIIPSCILRIMK